jgi:hypothetical protein
MLGVTGQLAPKNFTSSNIGGQDSELCDSNLQAMGKPAVTTRKRLKSFASIVNITSGALGEAARAVENNIVPGL